ncbi:uncharacterized protein LOC143677389 isoform X2 [Tamandua tetradactyla]|uniref:uncharacterized protein LOC143677389 isoform X2 n=1 Tax=Tamandua tetradactyla TaxID=48850 RepID=UPI004053A490
MGRGRGRAREGFGPTDTGATRTTPAFLGGGLALSRRRRPRLPEVSRQESKGSAPAAPPPTAMAAGPPPGAADARGCLRDRPGSTEEPDPPGRAAVGAPRSCWSPSSWTRLGTPRKPAEEPAAGVVSDELLPMAAACSHLPTPLGSTARLRWLVLGSLCCVFAEGIEAFSSTLLLVTSLRWSFLGTPHPHPAGPSVKMFQRCMVQESNPGLPHGRRGFYH